MNKRKLICILMVILLLTSITGCSKEMKQAVSDDMFLSEGMQLIKQAFDNIEVRSYKMNKESDFFKKYKNAKLNDMQNTFYTLIENVAYNYNLFKETDDARYITKCTEDVEEISKLFKANTKKE